MAAITGCGSPGNSKTATFTPEKVHRLDSYAYRLGVMPDSAWESCPTVHLKQTRKR